MQDSGADTAVRQIFPRQKRRARSELRELVLDAADELFARYGFEKPTIRDIAEAAGVVLPTLYRLFEDKWDIYVRCGKRAMHTQVTLCESFYDPSDPPGDMMYKIMRAGFGFMDENRTPYRLLNRIILERHHHIIQDEIDAFRRSELYLGSVRASEALSGGSKAQLRMLVLDALFFAVPCLVGHWPIQEMGVTTAEGIAQEMLAIVYPNVDWEAVAKRCTAR